MHFDFNTLFYPANFSQHLLASQIWLTIRKSNDEKKTLVRHDPYKARKYDVPRQWPKIVQPDELQYGCLWLYLIFHY